MAAVAPEVVDKAARKSLERKAQGPTSHGRGGAGNFGTSSNDKPVDPTTLETPTIKSKVYTTGRGGQGNMAKNDSPEEARRAQDVTAHPRRESHNSQHIGRGGGGNVFKPSKEELEKSKLNESAIADEDHHHGSSSSTKKGGLSSLADKAKEFLAGGGKKSGEEKR